MEFKYEQIVPNEDLPFKLFVFEGQNGNYQVSKHWHSSVEIFLVLKGQMSFFINCRRFELLQEQLIIVNSNEVHSIDCPEPNYTLVLQIPRNFFEKYAKDPAEILFQSRSKENDQSLLLLIKRMHEQYESREYGCMLSILSDFYQLTYLLMTKYRIREIDEERRKQNRNLEKLSKITNYIKANYREEITLEGVARVFGFSPAYLSKIFLKYAGIHYKAYVLDLRTEAGYRLLLNTEQPIGEIAMECGFPDGRSFAKAFRKRYGMLPKEYRRAYGKE